MTTRSVGRIMRERQQEERHIASVIPPNIPMSKRIAKFDPRSIGTVADAPPGPESRGFVEVAHNGVVSIGMELDGWVDPFHVRRRIATRFYFSPRIMGDVATWIQGPEFRVLLDRLVFDHCVVFSEGHVQAWIRKDGMDAHQAISDWLHHLERNHVYRRHEPDEPRAEQRTEAAPQARRGEGDEAGEVQAPRLGGVRLFGRRAGLHGS